MSGLLASPGPSPSQKAVPGAPAFPPEVAFFSGRRGVSPNPAAWRLRGDLASGSGQRLWMSIAGSSSIRRLKDVAVVMRLDELAPVGGRPASGRERRWFERFAEVGEDLPDRSGLRDEGDEPDVAATRRALEGKLLRIARPMARPKPIPS